MGIMNITCFPLALISIDYPIIVRTIRMIELSKIEFKIFLK